ncbi:hypothetical protein HRR83_007560 [Exophiala dermatitidis]|uniref:Uncharacterized protein n=1 Tax=Exophiala dermatitidis TaxID=5970 RepID=A0AAN6ER52_EXODE|nr:hypothetical protein HRR74_007006 [Exophiala dermatitidis]KAJ4531569.1 hypothetical protein HRR77_009419 [Exophiala dermatitidis]KAJ4535151.1 hypothetical protein HRR76_007043 [Exophiala dermatitidis]KAJ4553320.1 hypothetical protein HRR79_009613 [Exophiala dermatitidis]KAJ4591628.1 hypothetical protein HRR83_007560 [Exophiala dermatitidis]
MIVAASLTRCFSPGWNTTLSLPTASTLTASLPDLEPLHTMRPTKQRRSSIQCLSSDYRYLRFSQNREEGMCISYLRSVPIYSNSAPPVPHGSNQTLSATHPMLHDAEEKKGIIIAFNLLYEITSVLLASPVYRPARLSDPNSRNLHAMHLGLPFPRVEPIDSFDIFLATSERGPQVTKSYKSWLS